MIFALFLLIAFLLLWNTSTVALKRYDLPIAFAVKLGVGVLFMFVYSTVYGVGAETVDWEEFIHDSVVLRNVAFESPLTYLKFLFGFGSDADVAHYLMNTNHWSAGDLTLMNDSRNVLRVNSLVAFFSGGNIYFHISFFSLFVVLGFREIYLTFYRNVIVSKRWFWYIVVLFPSLLFWTSSMLKEPFMIIGFCLLIAGVFRKMSFSSRWWRIALGLVLMIGFKPYVFFCLLLPLLFYIISETFKIPLRIPYIVVSLLLLIGVFAMVSTRKSVVHRMTRMQYDFMNVGRGGIHVVVDSSFYYFNSDQIDAVVVTPDGMAHVKYPLTAKHVSMGMTLPFNDVKLGPTDGPWPIYFRGDKCGSYIELTPINSSFKQLVFNIPEALFNATVRPLPLDPGGNLKFVNFIETILLLGFVCYSFFSKKFKRTYLQRKQIITLLAFAICLLILIGWTTPVLGAIVRYRIPAYFALLLAALIGARKQYAS